MEALLLGLLGLAVGAALSPVVTALAAWPEEETSGEAPGGAPPRHGEAGFARPLALAVERPRHVVLLALSTGATFAAAAFGYDEPAEIAIVLAYAAAFLVCAATDLLSFRVPNVVTYPAMGGALAATAFMPGGEVSSALAGGALAGGLFLVLAIISRGGMGLGDAKLAAFAGIALGWPIVVSVLLFTALAGGVVSGLLLLLGLRRRTDPLPYAPFIAAAAVAVMLWQGTAFHEL